MSGAVFGFFGQGRIIGLRLIGQFGVMLKINVAQFGVAISSHRFPEKCIELSDQKICQVKGVCFICILIAKAVVAFVKRITMWTGNHLDTHIIAGGL